MINLQWSEELTRTVKFSVQDLKESIRHRYFLTSVYRINYINQRNMVIDTMLPQSFISSDMNLEKTNRTFQSSLNLNTKTAYAISPLTATAFGCKQIPIEHLCRILGFTKENIKYDPTSAFEPDEYLTYVIWLEEYNTKIVGNHASGEVLIKNYA